jgi:pyridoxal phosphate enzyme (YggS family)
MDLARHLAANLTTLTARVAAAATGSGRAPADIRLVAVSKRFGVDHVEAAVSAGLLELGESKVQEAARKRAATVGRGIAWHLIGHLQSNKARAAAETFDWIHSVDSVALLRRLDRAATDLHRSLNVLVQVDLAGESTKHGAPEAEVRRIVDAAVSCESVALRGLMVLPPWSDDPEQARPFFRRLRRLRDEFATTAGRDLRLDQLSMGMSHDLEVAIEEGATMIRVGTAVFGPRPRPVASPGVSPG